MPQMPQQTKSHESWFRPSLEVASRSPLFAYPAKLPELAAHALADCQAIIILVDPDDRRATPEALLQSGFALYSGRGQIGISSRNRRFVGRRLK